MSLARRFHIFFLSRGYYPGGATKVLRLTSDDDVGDSDLTKYRLKLLKAASEKLLEFAGYSIIESEDAFTVHFTTDSSNARTKDPAKVTVVCEAVVNTSTKTKETTLTSKDYRRLCLREVEAASETKSPKPCDEEFFETLTDTVVKVSLLQVKSNQRASLNLAAKCSGPRDTRSKGGLFLQYNASRLAAVLRNYDRLESEEVYPPIPDPGAVDFGALKEPEEWRLAFEFLLEYPSLVEGVAEDVAKGKGNIHRVCDFLLKMSSTFSVYYRRVKILLEPRDHLLPVIHARLLLAMSVKQVLENGLSIFDIKAVKAM